MDDSPELRWISNDNLHLTLRFIGEVERPVAEDIAAALASIRCPVSDSQRAIRASSLSSGFASASYSG
jgi:2'-5' RNA ligase